MKKAKQKSTLNDEERRKKQKREKFILLILTAIIIVCIIIIVSLGDGGKKISEPEITKLSIGEEGIINNNDNPNDCSGETIVGVNREDIEASIKSAIASDKEGFLQLVVAGRVFLVENCISIRKIDSGGTLGSLAKIRFLEGEFGSITGWIPYEFAVKK